MGTERSRASRELCELTRSQRLEQIYRKGSNNGNRIGLKVRRTAWVFLW